jgi:drug/metabolite transporter (DMT)-like permease
MERPVELLTIVAVVAAVAVVLLRQQPGSLRRQAIVGVAVGLTSALAVGTQMTDLVPDALELPALALAVLAFVGIGLHAVARRARGASPQAPSDANQWP